MKKSIGLLSFSLALAGMFLLGASTMWAINHRSNTRGALGFVLAHELETTGLCANALKLNDANERERLARLLEQRLDSAVAQAAQLTDQGARLSGAAPNLRESVRRAATHYSETGAVDKQRQAEALLAALNRNHE